MGNELLTREEILKEKFNSRHMEVVNDSTIIMYFAWILQVAYELELINVQRRDFLAKLIADTIKGSVIINREFDKTDTAVENYMYVITMYLQSMPNWEAWLELDNINSFHDAKEFLVKVKSWLNNMLRRPKINLGMTKQKVLSLGLENVTSCYKGLVYYIKQLQGFDYANVALKLKSIHFDKSFAQLGSYTFLNEVSSNASNFLEKLDEVIRSFFMEVSIMETINATSIIRNKTMEALDDRSKDSVDIERIDKFYKKKLAIIRKERDDNLDYYFESLHRPGRKKKGCTDEVEIEQTYARKKRAIESAWHKKVEQLKKEKENASFCKMELLMDEYSLVDIIKEYAIFSLAQSGKIAYPESLEERAILLNTIDISSAIDEFVNGIHDLTDEQRKYLLESK